MGMFFKRASSHETADPITSTPPTNIEASHKPRNHHVENVSYPQESTWHASSKSEFESQSIAQDGDTALALFADPSSLHDETRISPADERTLQWKIDLMILPYLAVCYAFFYIDKTTLSYAAIFGIKDDLKLKGTEYSWLSSIFYFGFLAWACELILSFFLEPFSYAKKTLVCFYKLCLSCGHVHIYTLHRLQNVVSWIDIFRSCTDKQPVSDLVWFNMSNLAIAAPEFQMSYEISSY